MLNQTQVQPQARAKTRKRDQAKHNEWNRKYSRTLKGRFTFSKNKAKCRGLIWDLTFSEYITLIANPCYYCSNKLSTVVMGTGLDRINNSKGYIKDNVLSCCPVCNKTRNNNFTVEETREMIQLILKLRKLI